MNHLPHLAQQIFDVPLMLHPSKAEVIISALGGRFGVSHDGFNLEQLPYDFQAKVGGALESSQKDKGYIVEHSIGIIPVTGTLVHKLGSINPMSGMSGYNSIRAAFTAAMNDPTVKAVVFDTSSSGGECSGCFDLVDDIYRARGKKPMMAILSEIAFSAAYAVASAADVITVPVSGGVGSIGIIAMATDYSQKLENEGVKIHLITYGKNKADGNPAVPMTDSALGRMQEEVNRLGEIFCRTVARNRGLSIKAVRDMNASTFMGQKGVDVGLADSVLSPEKAFETLVNSIR